jgi:hypothetical protein
MAAMSASLPASAQTTTNSSPPTRATIVAARRLAQHRRAILQHVIAGVVADGVVDRFELVEIDMHERDARRRAGARRDRLEMGGKTAPVGEAGQRIGLGRVLRAFPGARAPR